MNSSSFRAIITALGVALGLVGCGRKDSPEAVPAQPVVAASASSQDSDTASPRVCFGGAFSMFEERPLGVLGKIAEDTLGKRMMASVGTLVKPLQADAEFVKVEFPPVSKLDFTYSGSTYLNYWGKTDSENADISAASIHATVSVGWVRRYVLCNKVELDRRIAERQLPDSVAHITFSGNRDIRSMTTGKVVKASQPTFSEHKRILSTADGPISTNFAWFDESVIGQPIKISGKDITPKSAMLVFRPDVVGDIRQLEVWNGEGNEGMKR